MVWSRASGATRNALTRIGLLVIAAVTSICVAAPGLARAEPEPPAPGALVAKFWRNQLQNCEAICPYLLQGVVNVPIALVQSPGVYSSALATTGSEPRAQGMAAASVTRSANAAMTGIIDNDLNRVLPRAQHAFEVAVVEATNVSAAITEPPAPDRASPAVAFDSFRTNFAASLDKPLTRNPEPTVETTNPSQAALVNQIRLASAVLFQAPELVLAGATEAADSAATTLADTGDMDAARSAGMARLEGTLASAGEVIASALRTAPR